MGTREKLIERFKTQPSDFTWNELVRLFAAFGYEIGNKGKTHPDSIIKPYVMKQVLEFLKNNKLI